MIYLPNTTDKIQLVTGAAALIDVQANYIDAVAAGLAASAAGRQNTLISTATTTDIVAAPGASTTRTVKQMTIRNRDAALNCDVNVVYNANATVCEMHKVTLAPGECLIYIEGVGFFKLGNFSVNRSLSFLESSDTQRIFASRLTEGSTFLMISGTAYYVYMGRVAQDITPKFVEFHITTIGAGTDTKEIGLFSTPSAPNKSAQTLTKIVATGAVDSGTTTGIKRNTGAFATLVAAGTHLWAGIRTALATTQPTCLGLANDMSQGQLLTTTGGGALTGLTTAAGTIPAVATATTAPAMRVTLD